MVHSADRHVRRLRSQIVISSLWGGRRYTPRVFTEQGVAMLSSVLRSVLSFVIWATAALGIGGSTSMIDGSTICTPMYAHGVCGSASRNDSVVL